MFSLRIRDGKMIGSYMSRCSRMVRENRRVRRGWFPVPRAQVLQTKIAIRIQKMRKERTGGENPGVDWMGEGERD